MIDPSDCSDGSDGSDELRMLHLLSAGAHFLLNNQPNLNSLHGSTRSGPASV